MVFSHAHLRGSRRRGGFTLIEALAAILVMSIILPIAMHGVAYATEAAANARHRNEAAALAQSKMDELLATQSWQTGSSTSGDFSEDGWPGYAWSVELVQWSPNGMSLSNGIASTATAATSTGTTGSTATGSTSSGTASTASAVNNTLQEMDLHVTWTSSGGQKTLTLSTLVYTSGNTSTSGTTTQ